MHKYTQPFLALCYTGDWRSSTIQNYAFQRRLHSPIGIAIGECLSNQRCWKIPLSWWHSAFRCTSNPSNHRGFRCTLFSDKYRHPNIRICPRVVYQCHHPTIYRKTRTYTQPILVFGCKWPWTAFCRRSNSACRLRLLQFEGLSIWRYWKPLVSKGHSAFRYTSNPSAHPR